MTFIKMSPETPVDYNGWILIVKKVGKLLPETVFAYTLIDTELWDFEVNDYYLMIP